MSDKSNVTPLPVVSEERLLQLALNKLRALTLQVYLADGVVLGRIRIDPERFAKIEGHALDRHQPFVVQKHDCLQFASPSPLVHVGGLRYFDIASPGELIERVRSLWKSGVERAEQVIAKVRVFSPRARFVPELWTMEAEIGAAQISFHLGGSFFRVTRVDGEAPAENGDWSRGVRRIDLFAGAAAVEKTLTEAIAEATLLVARRQACLGGERFVDVGEYGLAPARDELSEEEPRKLRLLYGAEPRLVTIDSASGEDEIAISLSGISDPHEFEIMFEDAVEVSFTVAERRAIQDRPRRVGIEVPARLRAARGVWSVRVTQVSAGGVFAAMPATSLPEVGEEVLLGGFGPRSIRARVVHQRNADEARLLGTPAGVGLAFVAELQPCGELCPAQEHRYALVAMKDGMNRQRVAGALVHEGFQIVIAENLVAASAIFYHWDVSLAVMDRTVHSGSWEQAGEALSLEQRGVPALLVMTQKDLEAGAPKWAQAVEIDALDGRVLADLLETARDQQVRSGR